MNNCTFGKSFCYIVLAFFVTPSDLYAQTQQPLNLELPKRQLRQYHVFGPNATSDSKISVDKSKGRAHGEMLTIDTESSGVCERLRQDLVDDVGLKSKDLERDSFCDSKKGRYVHVLRFDQQVERPAIFSEDKGTRLGDKVRDFTIVGVGMMALIAAMPKDVSNWGDDPFADPLNNWRRNVGSKPVVDKDNWAVNYIGHPYSGGAYYVVVRRAGYSPIESFGFSAMMSTFWWEYGLEAFAERPSIQDLLITPIIGSLFGEPMYQWNKQIEADNGRILGSKLLGTLGTVLTDPAGSMMRGINGLTRNRFIYSSQLNFGLTPIPRDYTDAEARQKYQMGVQLKMKFWGL